MNVRTYNLEGFIGELQKTRLPRKPHEMVAIHIGRHRLTGRAGCFALLKKILRSIGKRELPNVNFYSRPSGVLRLEWKSYWAEIGPVEVTRLDIDLERIAE